MATGGYKVTSTDTEDYNCIAWAVLGDTTKRWWPNAPDYYWPPECLFPDAVNSFLCVLWVLGYQPCTDGRLEDGYEKVVIYADSNGQPTQETRTSSSFRCYPSISHFPSLSRRVPASRNAACGETQQAPRLPQSAPPCQNISPSNI
jgi:hypothetical protein